VNPRGALKLGSYPIIIQISVIIDKESSSSIKELAVLLKTT